MESQSLFHWMWSIHRLTRAVLVYGKSCLPHKRFRMVGLRLHIHPAGWMLLNGFEITEEADAPPLPCARFQIGQYRNYCCLGFGLHTVLAVFHYIHWT